MAILGFLLSTPTYVSSAKMWETEKLRLPEGALFTEDPQNYLGTQSELIRSGRMRQLTLARLQATGSNAVARGRTVIRSVCSLRSRKLQEFGLCGSGQQSGSGLPPGHTLTA